MKIDCINPYILIWTKEDALKGIISSVLVDEGLKTLNVSDQHGMFRLLEKFQPSVVILDVGLPKILGFEVYEVIKRMDRFKDIKVILLSATPQSHSGADEYIERDHIQDLLLSKVRTFIPDEFEDRDTSHISMDDHPDHNRFEPVKENMGSVPSISSISEEARRIAGIIVSDIVLYNKDKAERGAKDGTLYELLKREIEEGRRFYCNKVPNMILDTTNYYDEAIKEFIRKRVKD